MESKQPRPNTLYLQFIQKLGYGDERRKGGLEITSCFLISSGQYVNPLRRDLAAKDMKVLVACEYSGIVRDAFTRIGHNAWSCDLLPTERPGQHYQCDVTEVLYKEWDLIIAHPPCTYMANSGVRWLKGNKQRWIDLSYARKFFDLFYSHPFCSKIAIENPVPHKHAQLPDYTQIIQPWQFGHEQMKATCLWLRGLPALVPTNIVGPPPKDKKERYKWQNVWTASPGPDRQKQRSKTFEGIAKAMAEQWGKL